MGAAGGPNMVEDGMVFYYDTGNGKSYQGEPTENLLGLNGANPRQERSGTNYPYYSSNIDALVQSRWSSSNNQVTISFEGKRDFVAGGSGGGNDGYPVFYVYFSDWSFAHTIGTGAYDWTYVKKTFTMPNPAGKSVRFAIYHMNSGNRGKSYSRKHQIEFSDNATPFTDGTRSATEGLLDLTGNTSIDLSNVTFNSNAQMEFDGSDDKITLPAGSYETIGTNDFTIEAICKNTKTSSYNHFFSVKDQYHFAFKASNTGTAILYVYRDSSLSTASTLPAYIPSRSEYYHIVCKREGDNLEIFVNGVSKGTKSGWNNISIDNDSWPSYIGSGHTNEYTGGDLPITKIYNRALSAEEVKNNFNGIKSRFGI